MSALWDSCQCPERKKPVRERDWIVFKRNYNTSAFNGYHYTPSDYSGVVCMSCRHVWRTKAAYVDRLKDGEITNI